jgi:hypothetical protein
MIINTAVLKRCQGGAAGTDSKQGVLVIKYIPYIFI